MFSVSVRVWLVRVLFWERWKSLVRISCILGMASFLIRVRFLTIPAYCHMRCLICCFRARAVIDEAEFLERSFGKMIF